MTSLSARTLAWFTVPGILLLFAACAPKPPASAPVAPSDLPTDGFVGNEACAPCHAAEFKDHKGSRHMKTLWKPNRMDLGSLAPPDGPMPGGGKVVWDPMNLILMLHEEGSKELASLPIDLVLGSGKSGMTYLALDQGGSFEIKHSYFPKEKAWHVTPGQEGTKEETAGRVHSIPDSRRCIGCHSVERPKATMPPEPKFFGVGCESCHGAGGAHVQAMQKGDKGGGLQITRLKGLGGKELNDACGKCHRTPASVEKMDDKAKLATSRFQPYGLSQSKCFKASGDKLTCVTCHNPHQDASTDTKGYEKTCLSCHTAPKKACPVNPKEKCVSCHMPEKAILPGTAIPTKMADHFIRIYRQEERAR